jgi:hypothetical protein
MIDAVFTVVVPQVFRPPIDPNGIKGLAERCRARFGEAVLMHEMQMLIRYRLGAPDDPAPAVDGEARALMELMATNQLVDEHNLDGELDALIAEAELLAERRDPMPLLPQLGPSATLASANRQDSDPRVLRAVTCCDRRRPCIRAAVAADPGAPSE